MSYNTEKRNAILAFFENNPSSSYTAKELCANILTDGKGKSTVYRLLSSLKREGLIKKLQNVDSRASSYQYVGFNCREHLHLKCKECGALIHLDASMSHLLSEELLTSSGFCLDRDSMLYGVCGNCKGVGA
jgi:Fur family ferric uptake transcriptional regulator